MAAANKAWAGVSLLVLLPITIPMGLVAVSILYPMMKIMVWSTNQISWAFDTLMDKASRDGR